MVWGWQGPWVGYRKGKKAAATPTVRATREVTDGAVGDSGDTAGILQTNTRHSAEDRRDSWENNDDEMTDNWKGPGRATETACSGPHDSEVAGAASVYY